MNGPKWPFLLILIVYGPGVVVVNCWDRFCILGKAPRTKETLSDFRERCRVTRHSRVFRGLTGCQRDPRFCGVTLFCLACSLGHNPVCYLAIGLLCIVLKSLSRHIKVCRGLVSLCSAYLCVATLRSMS